jgi:hypothetical protein
VIEITKGIPMKVLISVMALVFTLTLAHVTLAAESKSGEMNKLFPPLQPVAGLAVEPEKTKLESPAYFAKVSASEVTLKWSAVEGADFYHLQLATDPNFKWLVANEFAVKDTSFQAKGLEAGKHYYWRVLSVKDNNAQTHRKSAFATSMFATLAK